MFATTLTIALAAFLASTSLDSPAWHADYRAAQKLGREGNKPLAVFVGSGKQGWNHVIRDGRLGKDAHQLLAKTYICVYVDTDLEPGKQLAAAFDIPKGPGLIVSDHTGTLQAFHHRGDLSNDQLAQYLRRYADPERVVQTTETNPAERVSYSAPVESYYQPRYYAPVFVGRSSGSC